MGHEIDGYIMPHPPIIIPEIGRGDEKKAEATIGGCRRIADEISESKPETIVVITPHGPVFRDAVCLQGDRDQHGSFNKFGHPELEYEFGNDIELCNLFGVKLDEAGISPVLNNDDSSRLYNLDRDIDHGALVPLYFIQEKYSGFKLLHLTYGTIGPERLYRCGIALREAVEETGRKVVVIASADMSHRLKEDGPYSYNPDGPRYDSMASDAIAKGDFPGFLRINGRIRNNAGECGHRSITILLGVFEGMETASEVYSYEGPFGVGYMTASLKETGRRAPSVLDEYILGEADRNVENRDQESDYVKLARKTIEEYTKNGITVKPEKESDIRKGVFVSIKKDGMLRGCIGTIAPTRRSVEREIIENAISAASRDPRFNPMEEWELKDLEISVDLLHEPEHIMGKDELDVREYGVIVRSGGRSGLLLPNLEGIDTVDEQVSIALRKAGISEDEDYEMERFRVERFK